MISRISVGRVLRGFNGVWTIQYGPWLLNHSSKVRRVRILRNKTENTSFDLRFLYNHGPVTISF